MLGTGLTFKPGYVSKCTIGKTRCNQNITPIIVSQLDGGMQFLQRAFADF